MLYDSFYESQLWLLFDCNKRHIGTGDYEKSTVKLNKGDYTLMLQIRHDNVAHLARTESIMLQLDFKLKDTISLDVYGDINAARSDGCTTATICCGVSLTLCFPSQVFKAKHLAGCHRARLHLGARPRAQGGRRRRRPRRQPQAGQGPLQLPRRVPRPAAAR